MLLEIIAWAFVILYAAFSILAVVRWIKSELTFKIDPFNPYRRYCRKCGQQQDLHSTNWSDAENSSWWEVMQTIRDEKCQCHNFSEYH
jgi:hypothetical protein